jgi:hypothetical protein
MKDFLFPWFLGLMLGLVLGGFWLGFTIPSIDIDGTKVKALSAKYDSVYYSEAYYRNGKSVHLKLSLGNDNITTEYEDAAVAEFLK